MNYQPIITNTRNENGWSRQENIIVAVNMNQKEDYEVELAPGIRIWMNSNFGENKRVTSPVVAIVKGVPKCEDDLRPGDVVLCHHNAFERTVSKNYLYGDTGIREDGLSIFRLEKSMVFVRLDPHGNPYPLKNFLLAERIREHVATFIEIPDYMKHKTKKNEFLVTEVGKGCEGVVKGDTVITYPMSDYEIVYSFNYKPRTVIRIKYDDVLAIKQKV